MTQEEKAKAYDKVIERANSLLSSNQLGNAWIYKLLPELKGSTESDDEKIRTDIIEYLKTLDDNLVGTKQINSWIAWLEKQGKLVKYYEDKLDKCACDNFNKGYKKALEKQGEQPTLPKWKYKKDHNPLTRDSITLNKYGCVAKSPSGALVSDVWILDFDELAKLPKEEIEKQCEKKLTPIFGIGDTIIAKDGTYIEKKLFHIDKIEDDCYWDGENTILVCNQDEFEIFEPKFKVGDWIVSNEHPNCANSLMRIVKVGLTDYLCRYDNGQATYHHEFIDKSYHLWTIQDAKDGDILFLDLMGGFTFIYNGVNSDTAMLYSFIISNDGKDVLPYHVGKPNTGIGCIKENEHIVHPATKEQRDLLFQKMRESGYEWVFEKKELKKIEQTPTSKVEPKFKVGDWILYSGDHYEGVRHITKIDEKGYYVERNGLPHCIIPFNHEICMRLWTIQDAKDGDVLATKDTVFIFKHIDKTGRSLCKSYCEVIGNSELGLGFDFSINDVYPATIEQRDKLFAKMRKAGYEWNADKKELMKIEQNLTVTDEELAKAKKDAYNDALDKNEYHSGEPTFDDGWSAAIWYLKKRNALPQNTWKPSATDIKVLEDVIDLHVNPINYHATLHSILEQLKKLREE